MKEPKIYLGVYGILLRDEKVLAIKKARGPYLGLYDLPGGGVNFGENVIDALRRELLEETGIRITQEDFLGFNEYQCEYTKDGQLRPFHHIGLYYLVQAESLAALKDGPDGQDSLGSLFLPTKEITPDNCAPIAYPMIQKAVLIK